MNFVAILTFSQAILLHRSTPLTGVSRAAARLTVSDADGGDLIGKAKSWFGAAMAAIGDIDQDGYNGENYMKYNAFSNALSFLKERIRESFDDGRA